MCCDICPLSDDCEDYFEGGEYCCPKCPEYDECPIRAEVDYDDFEEEYNGDEFDV